MAHAPEITSVIGHDFGITRSAVARHLAILLAEDWVTVEWLEYLWERRIGTIARNDPQLHHAEPFAPQGRRPTR